MSMQNDYCSIQNTAQRGVTSIMRRVSGANYNGYTTIAFTTDATMGMLIAEALNIAAAGERSAELLLSGVERMKARESRKFAVRD